MVRHVQLLTVSRDQPVRRRRPRRSQRRSGRPLRRASALLVDAFALGLIMIAALLVSLTFGGPWVHRDPVGDVHHARAGAAGVRARPTPCSSRALGGRRAPRRASRRAGARRSSRRARARAPRSVTDARVLAARVRELRGPRRPRSVELPSQETARTVTFIERERVARSPRSIHDPSLQDEPELLEAVTAGAGIALENAQLHAELRARLEELRGSRARIVEAGRKERQRLERNLHDGAQQRLIALSLELSLLEERARETTRKRRRASTAARREIAASLEELREVARGLHPAVVSGHGLDVALEQLVAQAPPCPSA